MINLNIVVPLSLLTVILVFSGFTNVSPANRELKISNKYRQLKHDGVKPSYEAFYKAMKGYIHLNRSKQLDNNRYLTLIDFTLSSKMERLWIIDMETMAVVHQTLVSHGKNTGDEFANRFSNILDSGMSSMGFYITGETYFGKHGFSLRLNGMDEGFNDNAYNRAIVMHSANYATPDFIKKSGRLGRSLGCPAIPPDNHKEIIELIKDGSAMFIYYPDKEYLQKSRLLL